MNKTQKYLLALLGVQIVLILVVFLLQRPVAASNNLIFPDLKIEEVTEIKIGDSSGNLVTIQHKGDQWVLPLQDDFPVQTENVQQLIDNLALIRDNRMVTRSESSHDRLSISNENYVKKVDFTFNGNEESIYFGSSPTTSNIHFRLDGKSEVFLTNAISTSQIPSSISGWVNTLIYQISGTNVQKIEISNSQGNFVFTHDDESTWSSQQLEEGYAFDQSKWSSLETAFTALRFVEPVSKTIIPEFGFDNPVTTMEIEYSDESGQLKTDQLLIGNQDENGNTYVLWSESDYVYKVSSYNVERFVNLTFEDYSSPIPTEEPGEE
jgi:hypothetical protein